MRSWSHSHTRLTYLDARHRHVQLSFSFSPVSFSLSPASPGYGAANCAREGKGGLEEREQVVGKKKPFALKQETLWSLSSSETDRRHLFLCQQTCYHGESTQGCIALHVQAQIRLLVRLYVRCNTPLQDGVVQEQCSWEPRYTNCHQCSRTLYHTCNCYNSTSSMHVDGTGRGCMSSSEKKKTRCLRTKQCTAVTANGLLEGKLTHDTKTHSTRHSTALLVGLTRLAGFILSFDHILLSFTCRHIFVHDRSICMSVCVHMCERA